MAQNVNPTFVKTPNAAAAVISTGTNGGTTVALYTGAANGSKITSAIATSQNTTSAFDLRLSMSSGGTQYFLGTTSVPTNAGIFSSNPAVNVFNATSTPGLTVDSDGNSFIFLPSSAWVLNISSPANSSQWTTAAVIQVITPSIGDF
jgi:hypothetical protein